MTTNDPLLARMIELIAGIGADGSDTAAIFCDSEAGPLAGHVALDRLDENGLGPLDVDLLFAASPASVALVTSTMCAAAARGLGYNTGVITLGGEISPGVRVAGKRVAIVAVNPAELRDSHASDVLRTAGADVAGALAFVAEPAGTVPEAASAPAKTRTDKDFFLVVPRAPR